MCHTMRFSLQLHGRTLTVALTSPSHVNFLLRHLLENAFCSFQDETYVCNSWLVRLLSDQKHGGEVKKSAILLVNLGSWRDLRERGILSCAQLGMGR